MMIELEFSGIFLECSGTDIEFNITTAA